MMTSSKTSCSAPPPRERRPVPALLLPLAAAAGLTVWSAGTVAAPTQRAPGAELRACQRRVAAGYVSSGIRISEDDARTIREACARAVQGRP